MPDLEPDAVGPLTDAIDTAATEGQQLNVAVAYIPDVPRLEPNLLAIQGLLEALGDLRDDIN